MNAYLGMSLYLIFASLANAAFVVRAVLDCRGKAINKPAAVVLLSVALSELVWVLPCAVQCTIILIAGKGGDWYPGNNGVGCDVMGLYSTFASVSGMLTAVSAAWLTKCMCIDSLPEVARVIGFTVATFVAAILISTLPLMGVGDYRFYEGFCYLDWYNVAQNVVLVTVVVAAFLSTFSFLLGAALKGWPRAEVLLMAVTFTSAWVLWLPASPIGLSGVAFPKGYMIAGGILGHSQALVNPFVYGIRWRNHVIGRGADVVASKTEGAAAC